MEQYKTEDELIEELERTNGQMTKDETMEVLSSLRNLGPQEVESFVSKIPDFPRVAGTLLTQCGNMAGEILALNNVEAKEIAQSIRSSIKSLQDLLEKEDLSIEDKKYVIEAIKCMTEQMLNHRKEERGFMGKVLAGVGAVAAIIVYAIIGSINHRDDD